MSKNLKNLILYSFCSSIFWAIYKVVFNLYLRNIGFENDFIGTITSIEMIGSAFLGILIGVLGDRFGKKKLLYFASYGFGLLLFLRVTFPIKTFLLTLSFFSGGFMTSRMMLLNSYIIDITDNSIRGKAFGFNFGVTMGSGLFGNFLGGFLGEFIGFKITLYISAIAYIISNILLYNIPESDKNENTKFKDIFNISDFKEDELYILKYYYIRTFMISFGAGLFVNFGNLIFKDLFDMPPTLIGISLSIAQFGAAMGSIFSPVFSKKIGPMKYVMVLSGLVVPLIISLGFVKSAYLFVILYALRFSFMNMTNPVTMTVVLSSLPKNKVTTINSFRESFNFFARSIAAIMFGLIVSLPNGYTWLFLISSIFYFFAFIVLFKLFKPIKKGKILEELYGNNS
ncbi:MAG: hypothetical protein PWP28_2012 [Oceanotoga sp.]|uniref:MFS family arabinose efflux permease n=1 Tax=Oceanotoga teriensis TaxID=515440 RepID=A0AA45HHX2_9BACT|nr:MULTISPECIES: MFS transporter [Oceanotoga]MDN5343137.1 hypothetical protein [Oceanotoga sp.]PWJ88503.1 putative MFS family arabinose efflux permease [Oceanotoga teriensis]